MRQYDIIIRNGTVIDGSGEATYNADVAISGHVISAIGEIKGKGVEEIDATGCIVTPGFVDVHTHYDGQAIWEENLIPSSDHGVTTVVIGNCGVGFAPCRKSDRSRLIELMEGVEDIPDIVMTEGLTWDWETYPEYLDALDRRPHDINIASYLPHAALRVFVMGERAIYGERATPEDIVEMAEITREALAAGAIGFSSSRTLFHRSSKGDVIPTADAGEIELTGIAKAMQRSGMGILQIMNDYKNTTDLQGEFDLMERVLEASGRPLTLPTFQVHSNPHMWCDIVKRIEQANQQGLQVNAQVMPRGIGMLLGFELTMHPFIMCPSYQEIADLPLVERIAKLKDPQLRARIIKEAPTDPSHPLIGFVRNFDRMFEVENPIDYEPALEKSIASRAAGADISAEALAYDVLLQRDGSAMMFVPLTNYADGNLDVIRTMMRNENFVIGLGDGGAHCGVICDASYATFVLTHWVRDRARGDTIELPEAVKKLAYDTANLVGLKDRGLLAVGYIADINVIDHERLSLGPPKVTYDLPAGGRRLVQNAQGYVATIVNGKIIIREGKRTGVLPGRLLRGARPAPQGI